MGRDPESEMMVKDLVVLILWMREDNTVFEEGGLGLWWKRDGDAQNGHGLRRCLEVIRRAFHGT